jgi:hypothetical protein
MGIWAAASKQPRENIAMNRLNVICGFWLIPFAASRSDFGSSSCEVGFFSSSEAPFRSSLTISVSFIGMADGVAILEYDKYDRRI